MLIYVMNQQTHTHTESNQSAYRNRFASGKFKDPYWKRSKLQLWMGIVSQHTISMLIYTLGV